MWKQLFLSIVVNENPEVTEGFFGRSEDESFRMFHLEHIIPLVLLAVAIFLVIMFKDKLRNNKYEKQFRVGFASLMLVSEMSYFWRLLYTQHGNIRDHLPITICGIATVLCAIALLSETRTLFDISYFWVLGTSIFALVMPTVITNHGPKYYRYYQFWFQHSSIFIAMFYMIFVFKWRPFPKSLLKSTIALVALTTLAVVTNSNIEGANYLFIANVDEGNALLNALPESIAVKVIVVTGVTCFTFFLAYLPWLIKDIKAKKNQTHLEIKQT